MQSLKMEYFFGGLTEKELRAPRDYSTEEIKAAENLVKSIVSSFTAKYGKGEIIPTKVNTVIYAWDFDGNELTVVDAIDAPDSWQFSVIEVTVK